MKFRLFGCVLAVLIAATPVTEFLCQMDCDQPVNATCHESMGSASGPRIRGVHHACDHDHLGNRPALAAAAGARDAVGTSSVSIAPAAFGHLAVPDAAAATFDTHGPPGPNTRSSSSHTTVLRI